MSTPAVDISHYLKEIDKLYRAGNATEHSYRPALKSLFENITTGLTITNEPKHIDCGAPDFIVTRNGIPLGYMEAKDIPVGIDNKLNKEQFDRYRLSLNNLIITDYLSFRLFIDGKQIVTVTIAAESSGGISPDKKQFPAFLELISHFTKYSGKTIYNSEPLAKMMADKAKFLASIITTALQETSENDTLSGQYEGFKKILIHNLEAYEFADMYAQTLAYGLFAARLNQRDRQTFTRYLAPHLIPQSNPFLRNFFNYIAGINLDSRIVWIVDALADIFNCVAVEEILKEFGKSAQDPYIHFYETFLAEYDPALRETRGVYYTPIPVVNFMVEAVDEILKTDFGLKKGLADHSKIKRTITGADGKPETVELHKVQILDPATGTGTFLTAVIDKIYSYFSRNKGTWGDYCEKHLVPRLNGFEILMASYAMAHFKLDMKLKETGFSFKRESRLRVFLTNSLEEPENIAEKLPMAEWLTREANEAGKVKRNAPVMVVLGNPPYSGESANITADDFLAPYKKEPGGVEKLKEKNSKWLNDDYVKFIRYGQSFIEKYGDGVLAYINNHSFLDNPTFRGMRWHLLKTFDKIYILDLHGNSKKHETASDGSKDENVFDIQVGVSINLFIKTGKKKDDDLAEVFHYDFYGKRNYKYQFLSENSLASIQWNELHPETPFYFFVNKIFANKEKYKNGFSITELCPVNGVGITTAHDDFVTHEDKNELLAKFNEFKKSSGDPNVLHEKYDVKQKDGWNILNGWNNIQKSDDLSHYIKEMQYRPFDERYIFYEDTLVWRTVKKIMRHFLLGENCGLVIGRQGQVVGSMLWNLAFIVNKLSDINLFYRGGGQVFPLYLYPDENSLDKNEKRKPNLNMEIVNKIIENTGLHFTEEKEDTQNTFAPIDILDYIYAVLYSNKYREKYKEFLKIDFPRVPYPSNMEQFLKLRGIGSMLRGLHLMENINADMETAAFPVSGSNEVEKYSFSENKVQINKSQYFDNVPKNVWDYFIGGYQPAQKWLKDRKGQRLVFEDIEHYQKIITVLKITMDIQRQIDEVIEC